MNNKFDGRKVETINIKENIKRKLVKKIWESQLIKNYFYKISGKHTEEHKEYKMLTVSLLRDRLFERLFERVSQTQPIKD